MLSENCATNSQMLSDGQLGLDTEAFQNEGNDENHSNTLKVVAGHGKEMLVTEPPPSSPVELQNTEQENSIDICATKEMLETEQQPSLPVELQNTEQENSIDICATKEMLVTEQQPSFPVELQNTEQENSFDICATNATLLPNKQLSSSNLSLQERNQGGNCDTFKSHSECDEENILIEHESSTHDIIDVSKLSDANAELSENQQLQLSEQNMQREGNELPGEKYVSVIDPERNIETLPILKSELNFTKEVMNEICREIFEGFPKVREENVVEAPSTPSKKPLKRRINKKSEVPTILYCAKCSYSTRHKTALINHMVTHRKPSETTMYKCEFCEHETKRKPDLKAHMIIHKDPSELRLFYCANCPYRTKRKCDLQQHMLKHQNKSVYKCPHCSYQTNNQKYFNGIHLLIHKDESDVEVYKCDKCIYQTKFKNNLNQHLKTHKDPETLERYHCNWCDFKTKNKMYIRQHMLLIHTCPSEMKMFKCDMCKFECKRKSGLKFHKTNMHMEAQQEYRCANCPFMTKQKNCIKVHVLLHMDPSKVKMYKCDKCGFMTRRKAGLISHKKRLNDCTKT